MRWFDPPEGRELALRRATNQGIWLLVLAFLVLGTAYSVVTPLFEASDELWHYPFVQHLANGGRLPVQDPAHLQPWRQEGSQPPLYYALAALVSRWARSDDLPQLLQRNPHADIGLLRPDGNANMVIHTPRESFPYRGAALAVHLARWLSVVLGALTVLFAYGAGLEALPRRPELALAAAAVVAFTPMFLFISGSVNNDNLLITLSTVSLWLLLRLLRLPPTAGRWALLGAAIGLAALSKASALMLLPLAALGLAWVSWRRRDWKVFLWGGACVVGAAALVAGWWYWRNWRLYHDPLGFNVFVAIVGPRFPRPTLRQLLGEWKGFEMAYWGFFGGVNVAAPRWFYDGLDGLALLGIGGLLAGAGRRLWQRRAVDADTACRLGLMVVWPILVMAALVRWTLMTIASQGRLVFPAIASLSYLLVLGLASWIPAGRGPDREGAKDAKRKAETGFLGALRALAVHSWLPVVLAVALLAGLAAWVPLGVIAPAYARPPLLTPAQQAAIPQRLEVTFGDQMDLLGYQVGAQEVRPGQELAVTLYWRARSPMAQNYSVFVHLLTENDLIVGQRDVYPGRGSFPTTLWRPGDAIADTYIVKVSSTAFSPSRARIEVGLYEVANGQRLPTRDARGQDLGDNVRFGQVLVRAEPQGGIANPVYFNLDNQLALVGYDLDRTALPAGGTLHLTLFWRALAPMSQNYTVFAHVLGAKDSIWAQKDSWPLDGQAPTSTWAVGKVITDSYALQVRPDTPPGVYDVEVGLYLRETMERLAVLGAGGHVEDNRILLNRVRVLQP